MTTPLEPRDPSEESGRALRRRVHRQLVMLTSGGAALVMLLALVASWGHLDTGARERKLVVLTEAQRLNVDADAAHEALAGTVAAALYSRTLGEGRQEPQDIRVAASEAATRLRKDLSLSDDLSLTGDTGRVATAMRSTDSRFATASEALVAAVLDPRVDVGLRLAMWTSDSQSLNVQRADFGALLRRDIQGAARANSHARRVSFIVVWSAVALALALIALMYVSTRRSVLGITKRLQDLLSQNENDAARGEFGRQVVEAFDMADDEEAAREVVIRAMTDVSATMPMELLLADSSKAHLARVAGHPQSGAPCCPVATPFECVAVRRGTAVTFADSEALHSCPKLRDRESGPVSATCVPVTFMGRAIGVLHATAAQGEVPDAETVERLARLATHTGARIGTLRATRQTQMQAATDSLTGLVNRRTVDHEVRELLAAGRGFAVAFGDLDRFKALNDTYGHDAGDRALRLFAKVLKDATRTGDILARYGGEEFVIVLPDRSASEAVEVMQRIQLRLADAAGASDVPDFTVSFGVTDSSMGTTVTDLVRTADVALLAAKSSGRDRVVLAGASSVHAFVPEQVCSSEPEPALDV
jgi:diguanylate cyclase (GGDEF)-like protein